MLWTAAQAAIAIAHAQCSTGCKHLGYQWGFYTKDQCQCVDAKDYNYTTQEKKLKVAPRRKKGKIIVEESPNSKENWTVPLEW